jgi:hypothetical protein
VQAILLHIQLKYPLERSEHKLSKVLARLPEGTQKVMHAEKSVGFLIPAVDHIPKITGSIRAFLDEFDDWRAIGLSGEAVCMNGSMDPVISWLNQWRPPPERGKRMKPENVALPERRKVRVEPTVKKFVSRTIRQVVLEGRPGKYRPKQTNDN